MNQFRTVTFCALCTLIVSAALPAPQARALPLALSGRGSGTELDDCPGAGNTCTGTLNAAIAAKFIGKSTLTLDLVIVVSGTANGSGGVCRTANGTGEINTSNKSTISFSTVGAICEVAGLGSQRTYNATYFIDGGTSHFPGAAGSGLFVAGIDGSGNAIVTVSGGLIK
jgi:hypothetical protein